MSLAEADGIPFKVRYGTRSRKPTGWDLTRLAFYSRQYAFHIVSDNGTLCPSTIHLESLYPIDGRHKTATISQRHQTHPQAPDRFSHPTNPSTTAT